jgi:hypothetical protein
VVCERDLPARHNAAFERRGGEARGRLPAIGFADVIEQTSQGARRDGDDAAQLRRQGDGDLGSTTARARPTSAPVALAGAGGASRRRRSIQLRPQLLQQCRGLVARHAVGGAQDDLLERGGG